MKKLLKRLFYLTPPGKKLSKYETFWEPGHYYSSIPESNFGLQVAEKVYEKVLAVNGIEFNDALQLQLVRNLVPLMRQSSFCNEHKEPGHRFFNRNGIYGFSDALYLESMIRFLSPSRIIEVGSGFSSALMVDVNEKYFGDRVKLEFIEPYPDRLMSLLSAEDKAKVRIQIQGLQSVGLDEFMKLEENDILFIDSSHVAKTGSDLIYLFFEVLPILKKGVYIHFHDIFSNFEYLPDHFKTIKGFSWNENYFLRAFLMYNQEFDIVLFTNYLDNKFKEQILEMFPNYPLFTGAQIWLKRI